MPLVQFAHLLTLEVELLFELSGLIFMLLLLFEILLQQSLNFTVFYLKQPSKLVEFGLNHGDLALMRFPNVFNILRVVGFRLEAYGLNIPRMVAMSTSAFRAQCCLF